ncbi:DUF2726 domain-containing protein [Amphritea sp. 2_MG-2023]|uniref:DUF2726 domain-containing protein n=1 Tax=Amphritea TaxID=515417 RepID=UPI001C07E547|nr:MULTISPECIES: DUF2726 domain-containing protein [Amphritea]MBU2963872.1 DUF2726 domain-containing protein [Amphritea atlantica]MDO6419215.1 DUF2726 domain-containing protein [Amphritea sp. 2_MG-2023]
MKFFILLFLVVGAVLYIAVNKKQPRMARKDTVKELPEETDLVPSATLGIPEELGYRQCGPLFTPAERSFYGVLLKAIDSDQHQVFGKVRVADVLEPQPSRNRSQWQKAFNAISAKHFDFIICKTDDLTPVAAIELDDKSHNQKHRQKRDELLMKICKQSKLPLLRIPAQYAYKTDVLKMMLAKELGNGVE